MMNFLYGYKNADDDTLNPIRADVGLTRSQYVEFRENT
jgi:hypothetical protein